MHALSRLEAWSGDLGLLQASVSKKWAFWYNISRRKTMDTNQKDAYLVEIFDDGTFIVMN